MTKADLLSLIEQMPDNMSVEPIDFSECQTREHAPEPHHSDIRIGAYQWDVDSTLTLRLHFRERFEGDFRRELHQELGKFFNVRKTAHNAKADPQKRSEV